MLSTFQLLRTCFVHKKYIMNIHSASFSKSLDIIYYALQLKLKHSRRNQITNKKIKNEIFAFKMNIKYFSYFRQIPKRYSPLFLRRAAMMVEPGWD